MQASAQVATNPFASELSWASIGAMSFDHRPVLRRVSFPFWQLFAIAAVLERGAAIDLGGGSDVISELFISRFFFAKALTNVTILRVGTNDKYASGWAKAFGKSSKETSTATKKAPAKAVKKAAAKKSAKKAPAKAVKAAKPAAKKATKKKK